MTTRAFLLTMLVCVLVAGAWLAWSQPAQGKIGGMEPKKNVLATEPLLPGVPAPPIQAMQENQAPAVPFRIVSFTWKTPLGTVYCFLAVPLEETQLVSQNEPYCLTPKPWRKVTATSATAE